MKRKISWHDEITLVFTVATEHEVKHREFLDAGEYTYKTSRDRFTVTFYVECGDIVEAGILKKSIEPI